MQKISEDAILAFAEQGSGMRAAMKKVFPEVFRNKNSTRRALVEFLTVWLCGTERFNLPDGTEARPVTGSFYCKLRDRLGLRGFVTSSEEVEAEAIVKLIEDEFGEIKESTYY